MTTRRVRSTDGNDSDDGSTWALAFALVDAANSVTSAGDTILVSQSHNENYGGTMITQPTSTAAAPTRILCVNDGADPPTALAATGVINTPSGNYGITLGGNSPSLYVYGLTLRAGSGASGTASITAAAYYENSKFELLSTGASSRIIGGTGTATYWKDCWVKFAAAGQGITLSSLGVWSGGGLTSGGTSPTALFVGAVSGRYIFENLDLSAGSAGMNLFASTNGNVSASVVKCKLPASWSGALNSSTPGHNAVYELINCSAGDVNYAYQRKTQFGDIYHETSIVRTGGAGDGTTSMAHKYVSNADGEPLVGPAACLFGPWIPIWNETVGSAIDVGIEIVHDNATGLTDKEVWIEVKHLGTSGFPLGVNAHDRCAAIDAGTTQTSSSETWGGTGGFSNVNKQKCVVSITPQEKGTILARLCLAKPSYTLYACPKLTKSA